MTEGDNSPDLSMQSAHALICTTATTPMFSVVVNHSRYQPHKDAEKAAKAMYMKV